MSVVTRCGAVSLVLGLLVGVAPACAQPAPAETSGSSWSDPPARGSAAPEPPGPVESKPAAPAPVAVEKSQPADVAKPAQSAVVPPATPAQKAASTLGVRPVETSQRSAAAVSTPQIRRSVVRPRMVERPLVLTRRPARIVERRSRPVAQRSSRRAIRSYAFTPESPAYGRVDPYDGRSYGSTWSSRRLAGWDGLVNDSRASRIARAREAGYSVMRLRTYARPDGSRVEQLSPFDGGTLGDLD